MAYRPRIGITMRLEGESGRFYLGRDYSEAVAAAGGAPVHIPLIPDRDLLTDIVAALDGVLLPGSDSDIDPAYFGEDPHPKLGAIIPEREQTDLLVLEAAENAGLPILAICFGLQSLNVHRGGSLIQDIGSQVNGAIRHSQGFPRDIHTHRITVEPNSFLERALDVSGAEAKVNSHHHQAIAKVGKDLRVIATAPDGIVEAVEDVREGRFILGLQWHPEVGWAKDVLSQEIFRAFVSEARAKSEAVAA